MKFAVDVDLNAVAGRLLASDIKAIMPLKVGGNNRLYRVDAADGSYALKHYFRHSGDDRNRLAAEFLFARFAWQNGVRSIPQPLACDEQMGIGLFSFIPGEPLRLGDVGEDEVGQALRFFLALNELRYHPESRVLPNASEACFSINEHLACVQSRLERLRKAVVRDETDKKCVEFVSGPLEDAWHEISGKIKGRLKNTADAELPLRDRVISPSDFGFHNVVKVGEELVFLDFEYAGWDDPAKVTGDFFSQVAVPVPIEYFDTFSRTVATCTTAPEKMLDRMLLLAPLYRIKWCCILLNHFLAIDSARREFARESVGKMKGQQLEKAKLLLASLENLPN